MRTLRVLWNDACGHTGILEDESIKDFLDTEYLVDTVGWMAAIDEKAVVLAADHHRPGAKIRWVTRIPREYVREVEILKDDAEGTPLYWLSAFLPRPRVRANRRRGAERRPNRRRGAR